MLDDLLSVALRWGGIFDVVAQLKQLGSRYMPRPFKFAVRINQAKPAKDLRQRARDLEAMGYYAIHISDHVAGPGSALEPTGHPPASWAAIPAMMALADATETVRIGARVLCVSYHHPVVLAKELATIDVLSDGRLEIGLGAGWLGAEYEAIGLPFEPAATRIDKLGETVSLIKALFDDGPVAFDGEHFHAAGFEGAPRPAQRPTPPLAIGGGSPRVLRLAGREADIVSINLDNRSGKLGADGMQRSTAAATHQKIGWVREGAGDRFSNIELEISPSVVVTGDPAAAAAPMVDRLGLSVAEVLAHPHLLIGSVEEICDELCKRRDEYGISYVTIGEDGAAAFAPVVDRLAGQ